MASRVAPPRPARANAGLLAAFVAAALPSLIAAQVAGARAAAASFAAMTTLLLAITFTLPTLAHGAFARGDLSSARRRYRALSVLAWRRHRRTYAELSLAAVELAAGRLEVGRAALEGMDETRLDGDARAAWLNNRAYASLRRGGEDTVEGARLAEAAFELRPDVPAIRHTWGLALLSTGKLEAAIVVLDELHRIAELPPPLEAERCDDLATAWARKGEAEYAAEYQQRAARARQQAGLPG